MTIDKIGDKMRRDGFGDIFVTSAIKTALKYEGVYDLMQLWNEETDTNEQSKIIFDIQEMIDECKTEY